MIVIIIYYPVVYLNCGKERKNLKNVMVNIDNKISLLIKPRFCWLTVFEKLRDGYDA